MKTGEPFRRFPIPTLLLLFAAETAAASPCAAQAVLEVRPGAARVWDSARRSIAVELGAGRIPRAALSAEGGHVVAGEEPARQDLFFVLAANGRVTELPTPPAPDVGERARPVLLGRFDRLDGAVWLEGEEDGFAVVAAAWNGSSWEDVETVAPARGRPQLAPSAAVLADGSWLVAWAGYDGEDDEIFWSLRRDGSWSALRRLHRDNRVPDLLPALTADGDGALAAWSSYDGNDYRVETARFDGERWRPEGRLEALGARAGGWQRADERSFLTVRSVVPAGWTAVELDPRGGVVHSVTLETDDPRPPMVEVAGAGAAPRLVWPDRGGRSVP